MAVDGSADAWGWQSHRPPSQHAGASAWGRTLGIKDAKVLPVGRALDRNPAPRRVFLPLHQQWVHEQKEVFSLW